MLSMPGWPRARQAHSALPRLPCSRRPAREQGPITAARRLLQASRAVRLDDLLPGPEPMPALAVGPAAGDGQDAQPVPPVAAEARVLAGAVRQLVPAVPCALMTCSQDLNPCPHWPLDLRRATASAGMGSG